MSPYQFFTMQRLQNRIPALPQAPESCTGAPGGPRVLHRRSRRVLNLAQALPEASEPYTGAPGGFRTLHQRSRRLPEAPGAPQVPRKPCTYSELLRPLPEQELHFANAEEHDESDLTELDIEEGEGLEENKDVDEEEQEEGNEEELVSSQDMEHSVIVVAPRR
ncbi:hypothetical protein BDD12DRAFT_896200 [Trichophaea hybrida]|nr:hypothetical protein BDD12DRAFT_896200 [Trichophaea hybrida]